MRRPAAAIVAAALVAGAGCTDIPIGDGPRKAMVRRVVNEVILPEHRELAAGAAALRDAAAALAASPDAGHLDAAQDAWRAARSPWMRAYALRIGPVKDDLYAARMDQFPPDLARITAEIAGTAALTPEYVAAFGANKKGFHALELFLFDAAGGDPAVLASLTDPTLGERRRQFVAAASAALAADAAALDAAWEPGRGDFVDRVVDIGGDGPYPTIKDATDAVVNDSVFLAELILDAKLGRPMGKPTGGTPVPALVQSAPSDGGVDDMLDNLRGLRAVYEGDREPGGVDGGGVGALVARASATIDSRVRAELTRAEAAVAAIPRPFAAAVEAQAPEVEAAWQATRELRFTVSTELIAALGATLSFNENDGD